MSYGQLMVELRLVSDPSASSCHYTAEFWGFIEKMKFINGK